MARQEIVIGVAYRQDTGVAAPLARNVGDGNPPSAHVNTFDERRLINLFPQLELKAKSFVGSAKSATNPVSIGLMAWPGNPWGTYEQEGPCIYCGAKLVAPVHRRSTSVENRFRAGYPNEYGTIIHQRSLEVVIRSRHSPTSLSFRSI